MNAGRSGLFACAVAALLSASCSLLVDDRADQCRSDGDCIGFVGTSCDPSTRTCQRSVSAGPSEGPSAVPEGGLPVRDAGPNPNHAEASRGAVDAACAAAMDVPNPNACTNARCRPFDNMARLPKMTRDGGLPILPPLRDAGTGTRS